MKSTYISAVLAIFLSTTQSLTLKKLDINPRDFVGMGVRFATGMNGDEDLGQDITMKGEKFHYAQ